MRDAWPEFLGRFSNVLDKPRRLWTPDETLEVWNSLAVGDVGLALLKTVNHRIRDLNLAEEILQNCLAELSVAKTYDPGVKGPGAFRTWVHSCLHHHIAAHFHRAAKERKGLGTRVEDDSKHLDRSDSRTSVAGAEAAMDLATMLSCLDLRRRDVLARQMAGQSAREIGDALGLEENHVRQLSFRAIRDLRRLFGADFRSQLSRLNS